MIKRASDSFGGGARALFGRAVLPEDYALCFANDSSGAGCGWRLEEREEKRICTVATAM